MGAIKKAVILDKYIKDYSYVISMLKNLEFDVYTFEDFNSAKFFLLNNDVNLIVSDLIVHQHLDGIENYINESIIKKNSFVLSTTYIENLMDYRMSTKDFSLFFEGMPKEFLFYYNPSKILDQIEVDFLIEDYKKKISQLKNDVNKDKSTLLFFNIIR